MLSRLFSAPNSAIGRGAAGVTGFERCDIDGLCCRRRHPGHVGSSGCNTRVIIFYSTQIHSYFIVVVVVVLTSTLFALAGFINAVYANSFDDISIVPCCSCSRRLFTWVEFFIRWICFPSSGPMYRS